MKGTTIQNQIPRISAHGSGDVPCGRTDKLTDMTKLTVAFRNSANAPKKRFCDCVISPKSAQATTQNFIKINISKHPTISQWVLKTKLILL